MIRPREACRRSRRCESRFGAAATDSQYQFVVGVGDRNGLVRNADVNLVRANLFVYASQAGFNIYAEIDGNRLTRNADFSTVRSHLVVDPPAGPGPNRPVRGGAAEGRASGPKLQLRWDSTTVSKLEECRCIGRPRVSTRSSPAQLALDAVFAES